jgi:hypothetical protein
LSSSPKAAILSQNSSSSSPEVCVCDRDMPSNFLRASSSRAKSSSSCSGVLSLFFPLSDVVETFTAVDYPVLGVDDSECFKGFVRSPG